MRLPALQCNTVYIQNSIGYLLYMNNQSLSSTVVKGLSKRNFIKSKMHRNLTQYCRQFFPYSLGSLLSCKDIPFLTGNELFAVHTRKIKTYPNPQPTVRSMPGSLLRHLDTKLLVAFQTQLDTVRSSDLHEDPLQLQWCSSW